ncbi:helix-turn-helix domain-containing protein [Streptomyces sp. NRRL S-1521]|uniref:helix-turn-helix domain-containing protein n=1 Tax=Streptomyces sp. NRRL S-1521 TaxID=1609100 RepID=UPI000A63AA78|nr:helix-turn-helix transcriptional regulator [Streptomyces sp. NRRL S-1521]
MVKHLAEAGGEESRGESAAGGRGGVRFLHSEAAPSAQRRLLGLALLDLRLKAGLKQEEVARRLNASESKISRIETGTFKAKSADLERLFTAYAVSDPAERERLRTLAAVANEPAWWQSYTGVTQRYLQAMVSYEELAERVKSYEPLVLHGQLQTAAYGRALISRARGDAQSHEELWQFRAERQRRFAAAANKSFIGVVDEGALRRPVGSSAIMLEQIEHLLCLMDSGRYQLRLAEQANPHVHAEVGPTTIFDFAERIMPSVVYSELFEGGVIIQDEDMVDRRVREFDALQYASLAPAATRRKLQQLRSLYR